jgi:hypothetical protein
MKKSGTHPVGLYRDAYQEDRPQVPPAIKGLDQQRLVKVRIVTRRADLCLLWDGGRAIHTSCASIFRGMILPDIQRSCFPEGAV